jgi:hypothetical protein
LSDVEFLIWIVSHYTICSNFSRVSGNSSNFNGNHIPLSESLSCSFHSLYIILSVFFIWENFFLIMEYFISSTEFIESITSLIWEQVSLPFKYLKQLGIALIKIM